jgi:hypothetical protein
MEVSMEECWRLRKFLADLSENGSALLTLLSDYERMKIELQLVRDESQLAEEVHRLRQLMDKERAEHDLRLRLSCLGVARAIACGVPEDAVTGSDAFNPILFLRIADLGLPRPLEERIVFHSGEWVWMLVERTESETRRWKGFGKVSSRKVKNLLEVLHLSLGMRLHNFPLKPP